MTRKDVLRVRWSKKEDDFLISYPRGPDGHLIQGVLFHKRSRSDIEAPLGISWEPSLLEELERRGYDTKTLRFEVRLKPATP